MEQRIKRVNVTLAAELGECVQAAAKRAGISVLDLMRFASAQTPDDHERRAEAAKQSRAKGEDRSHSGFIANGTTFF